MSTPHPDGPPDGMARDVRAAETPEAAAAISRWLEARVPAPIVALGVAAATWATLEPRAAEAVPPPIQAWLVTLLLQASAVVVLVAFLTFWRARTTIDPFRPGRASSLVTGGIYRLSRNPMYLSLLLLLLAQAAHLWSWPALLGPAFFVGYTSRFQIRPEEQALAERFGDAYRAYCRRVRRWI